MSKPKHVLVRFKQFWDGLEDDEQCDLWDFLTALRGPDNQNDAIKHRTTAVIRSYLLKVSSNVPATVNRESVFNSVKITNVHFK